MSENGKVAEQVQVPLGVQASVQAGPDGKQWVVVTVVAGVLSASFAVPGDQAADTGVNISKMLADAAREAWRRNSGLVVPGE